MDELMELRTYIEAQRYDDALVLIGTMEEMAKDDKLNKIYSFSVVLLIHLIKQDAEKRTTRSWETSIALALLEIRRTNKCRNAGGYYASKQDIIEILAEAYTAALKKAASEVFEGRYEDDNIAQMVDKPAILDQALHLILTEQ